MLSLAACAAVLGGCAALPTAGTGGAMPARAAIDRFTLSARFSLRHEERSYAGLLAWRHLPGSDELMLASPLGQGLAEVRSEAGSARLIASDGTTRQAADVSTLLHEALGFPLPVAQLADWLLGRIDPQRGRVTSDALGRPVRAVLEGWQVGYEYPDEDPQALPQGLRIEGADGFDLRLRIDDWGVAERGSAGTGGGDE